MEASRAAPPRRSLRPRLSRRRSVDPAFERLYREHAREVYQYTLALLTNPADAEDATQTTFLNAYRALQSGEEPRKPHNWLIAIAHNVCRMRWRQAGARPKEIPLEDAPEPMAPDGARPDLAALLTALASLSFNQRAAIVMRELEGRSYQEIAGVLGVTVSSVEALLFRARRRLQLERSTLGVLTTVPLPGSLASLFGGGGMFAAGGATVGGGAVVKAVALVAAGALTAGVGYESVDAVGSSGGTAAVEAAPVPAKAVNARSAARARNASIHAAPARHNRNRRASPVVRKPGTAPAPSAAPQGRPPARQTAAPGPTQPAQTPQGVVSTVASAAEQLPVVKDVVPPVQTVVAQLPLPPLPPLPAVPPAPPLPVTVPTVPTPPLPPLPHLLPK